MPKRKRDQECVLIVGLVDTHPLKVGPKAPKLIASTGEATCWVPNPNAPYYTNESCWAIHEHQNCIKFGRPDTGFMKWRWKPTHCELPVFNPAQFLELVRGKSLAFVGDSVGRNQMQSLICLLLRVSCPPPVFVFMRFGVSLS
ncbi:hypothetical protein BHE74_00021257 [Ensete ventricosum]|nr:hypothetical protein BHE74_00021257 [Ensete ventricosum]